MYRIEPGDLIYTGTPAGVGPVVSGDTIVVAIAGLTDTVTPVGPVAND
jgi:fumarylpyruvate hydrolase